MNIPVNFQVDTVTQFTAGLFGQLPCSAEFTGSCRCLLWFNDILLTMNMDVV